MEKDRVTEVIFREDKYGVFALFPYEVADLSGNVLSYQHIGQHSSADYDHCIRTSKPAKDYAELQQELINIGYTLNVVKKRNYSRFLMYLYQIREQKLKQT